MKSIQKNIGYQMFYRILTVITPFITSPLLARALGVEALGQYSASLAFSSYFSLFAMLGIENFGNRQIAQTKENKKSRSITFWNIYVIQLFSALTCFIIFFTIVFTVFKNSELKILYMFQGLWIVSALLDINWFYFGCEEFKLTVTRNVIIKLLTVLLIVLFIRKPSDLNMYALIMSGSMVLSQCVLWWMIPKYISFYKPELRYIKMNIKPILKLFIPVIALTVFHIMDKTMLNVLSNDFESGYYYSADKLINIPLGVITGLGTVMMPRIASMISQKSDIKGLLNKSFELTMFLTCSISFGLGAIAKSFVPFFFGAGYEKCILLTYIFIPVILFKSISDFFRTNYLIPSSQDGIYIKAIVIGALTNVVVNLLLIPSLGSVGAVLGTLIAEFVVLLYEIVSIKNDLSFKNLIKNSRIYIIIGIMMFGLTYMIGSMINASNFIILFIQIIIGAFTYLLGSLLYWRTNNSLFSAYLGKFWGKINGNI